MLATGQSEANISFDGFSTYPKIHRRGSTMYASTSRLGRLLTSPVRKS